MDSRKPLHYLKKLNDFYVKIVPVVYPFSKLVNAISI